MNLETTVQRQEENKETLQEAERLLKRLSEATWQFSTTVETECR